MSRYSAGGVAQTLNSDCNATVVGLSCVEQGVPSGTWTYTVGPRQGNWRGAESAASSPTTVGTATLQLSGSTTLAVLPGTLNGTISNFLAGQTVTFRLDNPTSGTTLTGSITPSPTPSGGQADVNVTVPAGTSTGSHTLYAIGSQGDVASAPFTVSAPAPTVTASTLANSTRCSSGYVKQGGTYYVYANVTNNPTGASADVSAITAGQTARFRSRPGATPSMERRTTTAAHC